jgi:nicotinamide-nucleotide amidase
MALIDDTEAWLAPLLAALAERLRAQGARLATAESCTGGLIAAACTSVAGSSDWFDRGFVTYSNAAKREQLGVPAELIDQHGAVSEPVARAMAAGALAHSAARWSVAVTGIAGPGGAVPGKPVGTVWLAWAEQAADGGAPVVQAACRVWPGDRTAVRSATVQWALGCLLAAMPGRAGPGSR